MLDSEWIKGPNEFESRKEQFRDLILKMEAYSFLLNEAIPHPFFISPKNATCYPTLMYTES